MRTRSSVGGERAKQVGFAWLWVVGAVLAAGALGLLATVTPIDDGGSPAGWIARNRFALTWSGELAFFSVITWGAGAVLRFTATRAAAPRRAAVALVGHAVALVSLLLLLTALGRLVYPVVEAAPSDDVVVLLASLVTGSVHLALLGLAVAALALPPQPRSPLRHAGIPFGALFVLGSFPWMLPTWLNLGVALGVACWGLATGLDPAQGRRIE